uniref:tetratricopeptide repeat protein n=1 Tax=Alistipes sp. TaxID=1872444 RepID=UPI004056D9FB
MVCLLLGFWPVAGGQLPDGVIDPVDSTSPRDRYLEGLKRLHIYSDTLQARALFEEALGLDSTYAPAHYKLSEIAVEGDPRRAAYHGERAYTQDTTNKFYLQRYAQALVLTGEYREALLAFRRLMALDRHNPDAYRIAALLEERTGDPHKAVAVLDSAEVLFGYQPLLGELKFQLLYELRLFDRAEEEALKSRHALPNSIEPLLSLAQVYFAQRRDSLALTTVEEALRADSTDLRPQLALAHIYRQTNPDRYFSILRLLFSHPDYPLEEKIRILNELTNDRFFYRRYYLQIGSLIGSLIQENPNHKELVRLQAQHLIAMGELEEALKLYKRQLSSTQEGRDCYIEVIQIERYLGRKDSLFHYMEEAIGLFGRDPELRILRGHLVASERGDYRQAAKHYKEVLGLTQSDSVRSVVWGLVGDLYQMEAAATTELPVEEYLYRGEVSPAWSRAMKACFKAYDKALRYDENNISVMNNYAYFLSLEERELEYALQLAGRVVELEPQNPTYMDTYAWVLFKLGRLEEAYAILQQAVSLDGQQSADLQLHYGDLLAALGKGFMAETYWKRALNNGYNAEAIQRRLEGLRKPHTTP